MVAFQLVVVVCFSNGHILAERLQKQFSMRSTTGPIYIELWREFNKQGMFKLKVQKKLKFGGS
jgi:hypothetical protein